MPTLTTMTQNMDLGNKEIENNLGFALEPIKS